MGRWDDMDEFELEIAMEPRYRVREVGKPKRYRVRSAAAGAIWPSNAWYPPQVVLLGLK